jgi:type II secretory pathway pseudopilin PulG
MSVLIGILLLLATLVIPNVMRMQDAMAMVTAKSNVVVFVAQAMSEAKKASVTVQLRDDSGTLVMESVQGSQDPVELRSSNFNGKLTLESVETPPVEANGDPQPLDNWSAYGDGQCDAADLTFQMTRNIKVDPELMKRLQKSLGNTDAVELVTVIAAYNMVSRFLIALDVNPEDHPPA